MEKKQKQPWFLDGNIARYKDIDFKFDYQYDYRLQIILDINDYCFFNQFSIPGLLAAGYSQDEIENELCDKCYMDDTVTGNASGSYWFSSWYAESALCHNYDLLVAVLDEFDMARSFDLTETYPEKFDVLIRCYLLSDCIHEYVSEIIRCYVEN